MRSVSQRLEPIYTDVKSFYNKATVIKYDNGDKELLSYTTKVAMVKEGEAEVYGTYSSTTLKHIKEFLRQNGFKAENIKDVREYIK